MSRVSTRSSSKNAFSEKAPDLDDNAAHVSCRVHGNGFFPRGSAWTAKFAMRDPTSCCAFTIGHLRSCKFLEHNKGTDDVGEGLIVRVPDFGAVQK
jgi:hypothetical protein